MVAINDMLNYVAEMALILGLKIWCWWHLMRHVGLAVAGGFGCELNLNQVPVVDPKLA